MHAVIVDALDAVSKTFHQRFGFVPVADDEMRRCGCSFPLQPWPVGYESLELAGVTESGATRATTKPTDSLVDRRVSLLASGSRV
jgi:hypothetical protein